MGKTVEVFFDFLSPPSYIAYTQIPLIAERTGANVIWRPMFTIGLHDITGNTSPVMVPNKGAWIGKDTARYAAGYGVKMQPNPHGLINILPSDRAAAYAEKQGTLDALMAVFYPAMFLEGLDISKPDVLADLFTKAGLDAQEYLEAIQTDEVKDMLKANTQEAADRGAFGAPTFFIGDNMHFGQDRLHFVEEDLAS